MTTHNPNQHVLDFMELERISRSIQPRPSTDDLDIFTEVVGVGIATYSGKIDEAVDPYHTFIQDAIEALGDTQNHATAAQIVLGRHAQLVESVDEGTIAYLGGVDYILGQHVSNDTTTL